MFMGSVALAGAVAFAAAAVAAPDTASADRTPTQWLEAMEGAFRGLDYDGVFTHYASNQDQPAESRDVTGGVPPGNAASSSGFRISAKLATFRVVHKVVDGVERERVVHLNGPVREILRTGDEVARILQPGDELLELEGDIPAGPYGRLFARRFDRIGTYYDVAVNGQDRVAGRRAVRLLVHPRDGDRFGYRLWLDEETGLLLRSELRDTDHAHLEIFQFTALRIGDDVDAKDLVPATEGALVRHLSTASTAPAPAPPAWQARWVPPGFELNSADVRRTPDNPRDVSTLVFSDGLATFSVFVEAMPETGAGSVVSRAGATVALTHLASSQGGDHLVTVVGEVPVATARRIAAGVYRKR